MEHRSAWVVLFKFGQRDHLEQLRDGDLVYLNPQSYFSELEADEARADRFEGTSKIISPASVGEFRISGPVTKVGNKIQFADISIAPSEMAGPVSLSLDKDACNIYCMFALSRPKSPPIADERVLRFGDSFLLVLNTREFLDRVCAAAKAAGFAYRYGPVRYYDASSHSGPTGPFRKPNEFSWQNEFRLAVHPARLQAVELVAGSLRDITSEVYSMRDMDRLCDFGVESAQEAGLV
jgi:hypothetical protein